MDPKLTPKTRLSYRLKEAAEITGFSTKTLKREIYAGRLEAKKLGDGERAAYLVTEEALRKWIDRMKSVA